MLDIDFRAAHLPNKYWNRRSVVVPSKPVVLDERFLNLNDILLGESQRANFEIFWLEKGVNGTVILPGELNYAYIDGNFFHLEKTGNQGFIRNGDHVENAWVYYLEYDDWQNDWLRDRVDIAGTIIKTGDWRLASIHIVQLAPLITGCNNYKFYLTREEERAERQNLQCRNVKYESTGFPHPTEIERFNKFLLEETRKPTDRVKFEPKFFLFNQYINDLKYLLAKELENFFNTEELAIYDIKKNIFNLNSFKTKNQLANVYSITSKNYHLYEISETLNTHKRINIPSFINCENLKFLNFDLVEIEEQEDIIFDKLVEKYLAKYPNVSSTRNKAEFSFILFTELIKFFPFLFKIQNEHKNIYTEHSLYFTYQNKEWPYVLNWKEITINGVIEVEHNVDHKVAYILFPSIFKSLFSHINKNIDEKISIGKDNLFKPKTAHEWIESNNLQERKEFLFYLYKKRNPNVTPLIYGVNYFPTSFITSIKTPVNYSGTRAINLRRYLFLLLPDYKNNRWVLSKNRWHEEKDVFGDTYFFRTGEIAVFDEIGEIDKTTPTTWQEAKSDEILNNNNPRFSKYAFIIPLIVRWEDDYTYAKDSYNYLFAYEFTNRRWRRVKEEGKTEFESKRFNMVFQFPLFATRFSILEILDEFKDLNDKYLRWNIICSDEMKAKNGWKDKGGEFDSYYDVIRGSQNEPDCISDRPKNRHNAFNNIIEIRIYSKAGASANMVRKLIFKLWVYFFGYIWDGHYNGAVLLENYGSNDGFLSITWAKPHNRHWYTCTIWINNWHNTTHNLGGANRGNGKLVYGSGSPQWDATKAVWSVGYQYANNMTGVNKDIKDILTCNIKIVKLRSDESGGKDSFNTFETSSIGTNSKYLFIGEQPWKNIDFEIKTPDSSPFSNFQLGQRLPQLVASKTFKTNRTFNPIKYNPFLFWFLQSKNPYNRTIQKHTKFNIFYFLYKVINPENVTSSFKHLNYTGTADQSLNNFREKIQREFHNALTTLQSTPFIVDIKNSEFIAVVKINSLGLWEFELISKSNRSIENIETKHHIFNNVAKDSEDYESFIRRLNSQFELNVYGQRINLKTRPDTTKETIDVGLKVSPINDPKQSQTSLWYLVEIKTMQDSQRVRIEVPKDLNAMNIERPFERENILRVMAYHSKDREIEKMQYKDEVSKYSFDIGLASQRMDINRNKEITQEVVSMAQSTIQAAQAMGISGWFGGGAGVAAAGLAAGLAGQAANMAFNKQLYDLNRQEHAVHAAHGERSLNYKGDQMTHRHRLAEEADRLKLYNMQTNINYPANSDALMFREENKQFNLTDVHLVQYYPDGDLLKFLCDYYKEYGFNIVVPNQRCFGISFIKGHIQFNRITSNIHPNETIRRMIEERALMGITLDEGTDWHADEINDHRDLYSQAGN